MIDQDGCLRCDKCHSVILERLDFGRGIAKCPRSNCRDANGEITRTFFEYNLDKMMVLSLPLDKALKMV